MNFRTHFDDSLRSHSASNPERRAVIEVGSNSVKLLVAEVENRTLHVLLKQSERTRLGEGSFEDGQLRAEAIARTAAAVAAFKVRAAALEPSSTRVVATSAAREAVNACDLVTAIEQAAGLATEIISGEQEAEWVFRGVSSDPALARQPLLVLDVGGGSTELIVGDTALIYARHSFPVGTIRLLEALQPCDPPATSDLARCRAWLAEFFSTKVRPRLMPVMEAFCGRPIEMVGTGGALSVLPQIQFNSIAAGRDTHKRTSLSREQVISSVEKLWRLSLAQRMKLDCLPPKKADVILFGAAILETVMQQFDFHRLVVSMNGLRHGVLLAGAFGQREQIHRRERRHALTADGCEAFNRRAVEGSGVEASQWQDFEES